MWQRVKDLLPIVLSHASEPVSGLGAMLFCYWHVTGGSFREDRGVYGPQEI